MGTRCCFACLKYLVFSVNFLIYLVDLVILAVSGGLVIYDNIKSDTQTVNIVYCTILILATAVFFTSFLGCCGAIKQSTCLLSLFFTVILGFFIAEITILIYFYLREDELRSLLALSVDQTVQEKYINGSSLHGKAWDYVQNQLECCGGEGPFDWAKSKFNGYQEAREIGIGGSKPLPYNIPDSCCSDYNMTCGNKIEFNYDFSNQSTFFNQGCTDAIFLLLKENILYILLFILVLLFIELVGMILSLCLCTTIRKIERRKT